MIVRITVLSIDPSLVNPLSIRIVVLAVQNVLLSFHLLSTPCFPLLQPFEGENCNACDEYD